jgi:hypothetical protein
VRPLVALLIAVAAVVLVASAGTPDARELGRRLDSESAADRDEAARRLAELGETARPTLEGLVREGAPEARRRARALLSDLDADHDAARMRRLEARALLERVARRPGRLAEGAPVDRRLGELGAAGAAALAERAARRPRKHLRPELAAALGRHASAEGVDELAAALREHRVLGSDVVRAARRLTGSSRARLGDAARRDLDAVLAETGNPLRRAAAALLLAFDPARARELASDGDSRVRVEAARALGRSGLSGAATLERMALGDPDDDVRRAALDALLDVPGAPRPRPAHAAARHPDAALRAAAARLLARDAVPDSLPVLAALASDPSHRVRAAAERSLAALGGL